jgi:hypothetical protein
MQRSSGLAGFGRFRDLAEAHMRSPDKGERVTLQLIRPLGKNCVGSRSVDLDLDWDPPLEHRHGAPSRLAGIDVYYDFDWFDHFNDGRAQFRNGKRLAERVIADAPDGKVPALLLTDNDDVDERAIETPSHYVLIINLPRYLELADPDAAVAYLARGLGRDLVRAGELHALAEADPDALAALFRLHLDVSHIAEWAGADDARIEQLRQLVGAARPDRSLRPEEVAEILRGWDRLDSQVVDALAEVLSSCNDVEAQMRLLQAMNENVDGRYVTAEVLAARTEDRLADARAAADDFDALLATGDHTETDLQEFLEANIWLLGLDYSRMRARYPIVRGTVDFILERFDGFHDLLELKAPTDPIIVAPDEDGPPPSASRYALSSSLARALAQVHVYRDSLAHSATVDEQFGLRNSREPRMVIVIGTANALSPHRLRVMRELNRSLHRVEIVPYDVIAKRARARLNAIEHYLLATPADTGAGAAA